MSSKVRFHLSSILALATVFCLDHAAAVAQEESEGEGGSGKYTLGSIRGDYAVVATYGANVAQALAVQTFDGRGNLNGLAKVNQPGPDGTRKTSSISFKGTYTINKNGTGEMLLTIVLPNGTVTNVTEDFVITKTQATDKGTLASEIVDQQQQPSAAIDDNVLVTHVYTRRER